MKSLFVSTNYPVDPERSVHGSFQRMRLFVEVLAQMGELEMLFFTPPAIDDGEAARRAEAGKMREFWGVDLELHLCPRAERPPASRIGELIRGAHSFENQRPYSGSAGPNQLAALQARAPLFDLIFAHRLNVMPAILGLDAPHPPVALDMDDVDHIRVRRALTRWPWELSKLARLTRLPALMVGEYRALKRSEVSFVCSGRDRARVTRLFPGTNVRVVENAVEVPEQVTRRPDGSILFIGSFNYGPNVEAARELIREIWPVVKARVPGARLRIAGRESRERLTAIAGEGVELLGFVDELPELYASSSVMVCPIRRGSGTRIKIIEAAAHGVPVVSTTIGAEGLSFRPQADIVIEDRPSAMADACVELMTDAERAEELARNAREVVAAKYGRRTVQAGIRGALEEVVE